MLAQVPLLLLGMVTRGVTLGDGNRDEITFNGRVKPDIVPGTNNNTRDLGPTV